MKNLLYQFLMLIMLSIFGLTGCAFTAFTVKNTDGLALAYKDIDRAHSYALELKSMEDKIPEQARSEAKDLYIHAKAEINSYLQKAIINALDCIVDNPKEEYMATQGKAKVDAFENKVKELRGMVIKEGVLQAWKPSSSLAAWSSIPEVIIKTAEGIIRIIRDLNQKTCEEGRKKFVEEIIKNMMKDYDALPKTL
jgi:hypothetical protein